MYGEYLSREAVEGFGYVKIGQVIHTLKYADDLVLMTKEEMMLWGKIDDWKMLWNGNKCGKNQGNETRNETVSSIDYVRSKTISECGVFQLFG